MIMTNDTIYLVQLEYTDSDGSGYDRLCHSPEDVENAVAYCVRNYNIDATHVIRIYRGQSDDRHNLVQSITSAKDCAIKIKYPTRFKTHILESKIRCAKDRLAWRQKQVNDEETELKELEKELGKAIS